MSPHAGISLLYDVSMGVIYWTVWKTWGAPYSHLAEQKMVRRIQLNERQAVSPL